MAHSSHDPEDRLEHGDDDVFYTLDKKALPRVSDPLQSNGHSSKVKTIDRYGFIIGSGNDQPDV